MKKEDKYTITNGVDLNSAVALQTNYIYKMCNAKTQEEVNNSFMEAKDLLIAIYKFNTDKLSNSNK